MNNQLEKAKRTMDLEDLTIEWDDEQFRQAVADEWQLRGGVGVRFEARPKTLTVMERIILFLAGSTAVMTLILGGASLGILLGFDSFPVGKTIPILISTLAGMLMASPTWLKMLIEMVEGMNKRITGL